MSVPGFLANRKTKKRFRAGDRVRLDVPDFYAGLPAGAEGTVGELPGYHGRSCYPDPHKVLVFVEWDCFRPTSTWRQSLSHLPRRAA